MTQPVLWQARTSIFCEKVRFALDYKAIPYRPRTLVPGMHVLSLRVRGRGSTVPVLDIDGESVRDSTDIVAALERRKPNPPLYPEDPQERAEALELEDFLDDCGHEARRVVLDPILDQPETLSLLFLGRVPGWVRWGGGLTNPLVNRLTRRYYTIDGDAVEAARGKVVAAVDRIEARLAAGGGDYLVGDRFSVADLTAASILGVLIWLPQYPGGIEPELPAEAAAFREALNKRDAFHWIADIYGRHRGASAA